MSGIRSARRHAMDGLLTFGPTMLAVAIYSIVAYYSNVDHAFMAALFVLGATTVAVSIWRLAWVNCEQGETREALLEGMLTVAPMLLTSATYSIIGPLVSWSLATVAAFIVLVAALFAGFGFRMTWMAWEDSREVVREARALLEIGR